MITIDGETGKGSGRSISNFNLFDALSSCDNLLEKYGGHSLAAGLTINIDKIDEFTKRINEYAEKVTSESDFTQNIY